MRCISKEALLLRVCTSGLPEKYHCAKKNNIFLMEYK
jgi:hypothetical protein